MAGTEVLIQSHDWGNDVRLKDYTLPFSPAKIAAIYENTDTNYCDGEAHPAIGTIVRSAEELLEAVGWPGGYQHCQTRVVVIPLRTKS